MERRNFLRSSEGQSQNGPRRSGPLARFWWQVCAGTSFALAFTCIAQDGHPPATAAGLGMATQQPAAATAVPENGAKPSKQQKAAAADNERKRQISDESTQLLSMAEALKAEVDKTNKDMLSLNVIRKADEIERLARTVKEKMKQSNGAS